MPDATCKNCGRLIPGDVASCNFCSPLGVEFYRKLNHRVRIAHRWGVRFGWAVALVLFILAFALRSERFAISAILVLLGWLELLTWKRRYGF
jgi:hypothetical protein